MLIPAQPSAARQTLYTLGENRGRGNLLGLQPWMTTADYASEAAFRARLTTAFAQAAAAGVLQAQSIVVLPEYLGTWLLVAGEGTRVLTAPSVHGAMAAMVTAHPFGVLRHWLASREPQRILAAVMRRQAPRAAAIYQRVMGELARQFGVHLVAGSLVLPDPTVVDGQLHPGHGPLYNVAAVFAPDGHLLAPLVRKVYPTAEERPFLTPGRVEDLPVFDTPAGRLGVLVCADAWFPDCYARLNAQGVELLAVISFSWQDAPDARWTGYSGALAPADVDPADMHLLTRNAAWQKYALAGRFAGTNARAALNVCYRGHLWDWQLAGRPAAITPTETRIFTQQDTVEMVNVWG